MYRHCCGGFRRSFDGAANPSRKSGRPHFVTGCYAQRAPSEIAALPGVQWVVGNSQKADIASIVSTPLPEQSYHGGIYASGIFEASSTLFVPDAGAPPEHARPNLKVQDGCNNRCAFCVIPFVRGPSRFLDIDQVVASVCGLSERYREVVLTGINLGRWGREAGSLLRLPDLLRRLLARLRSTGFG